MATKAAKKTTSKEKIEFLQRERDQLHKENVVYSQKIDLLNKIIESQKIQVTELLAVRDALERQLADRPKSGREWVLRKLGL